jgi:hypothetical protein
MTDSLIIGGPSGHGSTLDLLLSASLLLRRRFNHELLALPLVATHHVVLNEPATTVREGATTRSRGCLGDGTRRDGDTTAAAMDGGGGTGQWCKMAQWRRRMMAQWQHGGGDTGGEVAAVHGRRTGKEKIEPSRLYKD